MPTMLGNGAVFLALGLLLVAWRHPLVAAFTMSQSRTDGLILSDRNCPSPRSRRALSGRRPRTAWTALKETFGEDGNAAQESSPQQESNASFLEQASLDGAAKIATLSVEERTKRAFLAEAVEDRMVLLADELDLLLGPDGMPGKTEDRDEVVILAREIKALRDQYQSLVSGGSSYMLDSFNGTSDDMEGSK